MEEVLWRYNQRCTPGSMIRVNAAIRGLGRKWIAVRSCYSLRQGAGSFFFPSSEAKRFAAGICAVSRASVARSAFRTAKTTAAASADGEARRQYAPRGVSVAQV